MARVKMHCRQRRRDSRVPGFVCRYIGGGEAVVDALGVLGGGVVALRWRYPILLLRSGYWRLHITQSSTF